MLVSERDATSIETFLTIVDMASTTDAPQPLRPSVNDLLTGVRSS